MDLPPAQVIGVTTIADELLHDRLIDNTIFGKSGKDYHMWK